MKIKKDGKFVFVASIIVIVGIIVLDTYRFLNSHDISTLELVFDIIMIIVMCGCLFKSIEKK